MRLLPVARSLLMICALFSAVMARAIAGWTPLPPWEQISDLESRRCASCHSAGGVGVPPLIPKLAGQNAAYLEQQMLNFQQGIRKGAVMYYQLSDLSPAEIAALARYFAGLRPELPLASMREVDPDGAELYRAADKFGGISCADCHGSDGRGGPAMPSLAGQHSAYLAMQMKRFRDGTRNAGQTQVHPRAAKLGDEEIAALSRYLSTRD